MSYESAVPVACTLLLGKVIGVTVPDTRSMHLGGRAASGYLHSGRITSELREAKGCGLRVECQSLSSMATFPRTDIVARQSLQMFRSGYRGE
jgi:hypothetical protein